MTSRSHTYATALLEAWESSPAKEQPHVIDRFIAELQQNHLGALAPEILTALEREISDRAREAEALITVARDATQNVKGLQQFAPANTVVDDNIVGGFTVRRQSEILDASVRGGLDTIRRALATS